MARVTVEDCLEFVDNRFKLVLLASKRARQLAMGTEPLVEWENDKPTVVALREIEQELVNEEMMQAALAEPVEEEAEYSEDDLAAALHAEISRELNQSTPDDSASTTSQSGSTQVDSPSTFQNSFFANVIETEAGEDSREHEDQEKISTEEASTSIDSESPNLFGAMFEKEIASSVKDDSTMESEPSIGDDTSNNQNELDVKEEQAPSSYDGGTPTPEGDDDPSRSEGGQGF